MHKTECRAVFCYVIIKFMENIRIHIEYIKKSYLHYKILL